MDEKNYKILVNLLPDIIYKIDSEGRFTYLNDSISSLGYKPDELIGRHFSVIVHQDDVDSIRLSSVLSQAGSSRPFADPPKLFDERRTGHRISKHCVFRLRPKGGSFEGLTGAFSYCELLSVGLYEDELDEAARNYSGTIGVLRDVTSAKHSDESLVKSEKHYYTLLENATDIIAIIATDGTILFVSPSVRSMLGYLPLDLTGENLFDYLHPDDRDSFQNHLTHEQNTGDKRSPIEYRHKHGNGTWRTFEVLVKPVMDEAGDLMCYIINSHDITERKQSEELLRNSLIEKEKLLLDLNHRVKNNLQIVISLLNLQAGSAHDSAFNALLDIAKKRIQTIAMVHERLSLADSYARIDLSEYIKALVNDLYSTYLNPERLSFHIDARPVSLHLNKAVPCGLIVNELISNSINHAFPPDRKGKGMISITIRGGEELIEIGFHDNGVGIPETISLGANGSVGLSLVQVLTNQLKGEIELGRGNGTTYKIVFRP